MIWKVTDLENETLYLYSDMGFLSLINVSKANFFTRWRIKKTKGIVFASKWYIKQDELL